MGATDNMLCFALYSATRKTTRTYRQILEPWNLTYPQYLVLFVLWKEGSQSVRQLGEELQLDSGTLSPLLKRLESAGYVSRRRSHLDERTVLVHLTEEGEQLQQHLAKVPQQVAVSMGLSGEEEMLELITRLNTLSTPDELPQ